MDIEKQRQQHQHRQTIINLYNSGILPDMIATQLDITKDEVHKVIKEQASEEERKYKAVKRASNDVATWGFLTVETVPSSRPRG